MVRYGMDIAPCHLVEQHARVDARLGSKPERVVHVYLCLFLAL